MTTARWARRLLLALVLAFVSAPAYAIQLDCNTYAEAVYGVAEIRDLDAKLEKHLAMVQRRARQASATTKRFAEAEVRRIYRLRQMSAEQLRDDAFKRCTDNLGELPVTGEG